MKISKEIKVGFVAIFAIAMSIWGVNYLKGNNLFIESKSVYAVYPKVPGLAVSSPIIINGVQCGVVDDIYFHPDKSSNVVVKLNITESAIKISKNSVADLISTDFMGGKAIGLKLGNSKAELENGDTIQSHFEKSMLEDFSEQMLPIKDRAEHLMTSMDTAVTKMTSTLENINGMFTTQNKRNFSQALANLKTALEGFDQMSITLNRTVKTKIDPTMDSFGELADSLKKLEFRATLTKAQTALEGMSAVMDKMNKGEGTMGKLMTNDSLYNNLTGATKEMEELLEDIKLHPKRYFRVLSRKEIPYKKD
ncbi:MlaD family protein [Vicingaceae bacterium]|nr:MlaD family protein [Vicingaceae bacterium]